MNGDGIVGLASQLSSKKHFMSREVSSEPGAPLPARHGASCTAWSSGGEKPSFLLVQRACTLIYFLYPQRGHPRRALLLQPLQRDSRKTTSLSGVPVCFHLDYAPTKPLGKRRASSLKPMRL